MAELSGWRLWWVKRRWYERNRRLRRRWRINRHLARAGAYIRFPVEGEVLEALDEGRLVIGEGTLLEPGCWLTLSPQAGIEIGYGCFLNRNVMLAALERIEIGDHVMFANGCFVGDAAHRFDDPDKPVTWQGFTSKGPVRIGSNCWFGVNCVVTSGVRVGERCVVGANSVVNEDLPPATIAAGVPGLACRRYSTRHYVESTFGSRAGCIHSTVPGSAAESVEVRHIDFSGDTAEALAIPTGGPSDGERIKVQLVRVHGVWEVDSL